MGGWVGGGGGGGTSAMHMLIGCVWLHCIRSA